jgi:hypothetical protein
VPWSTNVAGVASKSSTTWWLCRENTPAFTRGTPRARGLPNRHPGKWDQTTRKAGPPMLTIILIVVLVLLLFGGFGYSRRGRRI